MTRLTDSVNLFMQMAISTKDSGKMIRLMDMVTILMQMEQLTVVNGKMISNTAKE